MTADSGPLHASCPRCQARFPAPTAPPDDRICCPQCQFEFTVRKPSQNLAPIDDYPLLAADSPPEDESIAVICSVCHARMLASERKVGQRMICPDCGTANIVPRQVDTRRPKKWRSAEEIGDYPLACDIRQVAGHIRASEAIFVPVRCPVCQTRLHGALEQVGQTLTCPDCGSSVVVPSALPQPPHTQPAAVCGECYELAQANEVPSQEPPPTEEPAEEASTAYERPTLPPHPLLCGTFSFPFSRGARPYLAIFAIGAAVSLAAALKAAELGGVPMPFTWLNCMLLMTVSGMLGAMTVTFGSACALVITHESANGCDRCSAWPDFAVFEWIGNGLYLLNGICASILPGAALGWVLARLGLPRTGVVPVVAFLLFPIVLLSMLDNGSPLGAASTPVFRTLRTCAKAWTSFYLATAMLIAAGAAIAWMAAQMPLLLAAFFGGLVIAVVWFVYFRLLGRLAWYCTERSAELEEATFEEDDNAADAESNEVEHKQLAGSDECNSH